MASVEKEKGVNHMEYIAILIPVAVAVLMSIPGILSYRGQRRRELVDVAARYEDLLNKQITRSASLQAQLDKAEEIADEKDKRLGAMVWHVTRLKAQLVNANIIPVEE
jgi:hypothetical protein